MYEIQYVLVNSLVQANASDEAYLTPCFTVTNDQGEVYDVTLQCGEEIALAFFDGDALALQEQYDSYCAQYKTFMARLQAHEECKAANKDPFKIAEIDGKIQYCRKVVDAIGKQKTALQIALEYIDRFYGPEA